MTKLCGHIPGRTSVVFAYLSETSDSAANHSHIPIQRRRSPARAAELRLHSPQGRYQTTSGRCMPPRMHEVEVRSGRESGRTRLRNATESIGSRLISDGFLPKCKSARIRRASVGGVQFKCASELPLRPPLACPHRAVSSPSVGGRGLRLKFRSPWSRSELLQRITSYAALSASTVSSPDVSGVMGRPSGCEVPAA